jgi:hypothetical protein
MPDEIFKKQREGYMVKKVEIPKKMHSQGNKFWNEITNHQFCFARRNKRNKYPYLKIHIFFFVLAQLEVDIIKSLERDDLLRFYDHYISPNSIHRRKLALHVNPSPLALQVQIDDENEGESAALADEELPSTADEEYAETITTEISHESIKLTEQPPIIDTLIEKDLQESANGLPKKEINLPKVKYSIIKFFIRLIVSISIDGMD